jgi:nucleoid-associated protein YgaU/DNA-binding SARP family transcriptional activator
VTGRVARPGRAGRAGRVGRLAVLARGLLALAALAGLLAGIPAVLLAVGADPRTVRLPTLERVRQLLTSPDDGTLLIAVLRVIGWAGWAGFAVSVVVETVAAVAGWTVPVVRGLAGVQRPAAYLVAAVAAALAVPAAATASAPAAHAAPAAAALPNPSPGPHSHSDAQPSTGTPPPATPGLAAPTGPAAWAGPPGHTTGPAPDRAGQDTPAHRLPTVRVGRYDSLWRIAERHLGDGRRWPEIYRLNTGRRQPGGHTLTDPDHVEEGWTLLLPPDAVDAGPPTHGDSRPGEVIVVQPGDTLSGIAERHLGHAGDWPAILTANTGLRQADGGELSDPDLIRPGWQLTIPAEGATRAGSPVARSAAHPVYEVVGGDRLGTIAERFLGDRTRYQEITALNRALIRDDTGPHGPDHIEPGWRLVLPADAHDAGPRRYAAGRVSLPPATPVKPGHRPETRTRPTAPRPPATTGPTAPAPRGTTSTTGPSAPAGAPAQAAPSSTGSPANEEDRARPHGGVELPGGWVSIPLAAAIAAAGSMVWLRRRHRYAPGPVARPVHDDPDLRPLPPAVAVLRGRVREQAPQLLDASVEPRQPTVAEYAASGEPPVLPPVGPSGPDLAGLTGLIPAAGLGLAGPGAAPAARGLLVATLSSGGPADPDARGQVLIPAGTLTTLLGAEAAQIGPIPRLRTTAGLTDALTVVDELLIERRRLLDQHGAADPAGLHATDPYHPPMPPAVLIAEAPPAGLQARLTTSLQLGAPLQVTAVLLGHWPAGKTITVQTDGAITDDDSENPADDQPRLAILGLPTTVQLLQVLSEAHTGQPAAAAAHEPAATPGAPATADGGRTADTGTAAATDASALPGPPPAAETGDTPAAAVRPRPAAGARARMRVLAAPAILDRDGKPVPGLRHHAAGLLVYLAVHRDGANLPDIMEAFWPTATIRRASERLSTEVASLRRSIRQAAADTTIQPVVNTGSRYHLDPDLLDIDLWTMLDALSRTAGTADPAARITALREAVAADTGPLGDGYDYDWLEQHREQYRRHGIQARLQLAGLLAATDPAQAADLTRAAAELDPYSEDLARQAMQAAARAGKGDVVTAVLEQLRVALVEIDEEPSTQTVALAGQLQREIAGQAHRRQGGSRTGDVRTCD